MAENEIITQETLPDAVVLHTRWRHLKGETGRVLRHSRRCWAEKFILQAKKFVKLLRLRSTHTLQDYRDNGTIAYVKSAAKDTL